MVAPRLSAFREAVDDHQLQIAAELVERGIAVAAEADSLDVGDLARAAGRTVAARVDPPRFVLGKQAA